MVGWGRRGAVFSSLSACELLVLLKNCRINVQKKKKFDCSLNYLAFVYPLSAVLTNRLSFMTVVDVVVYGTGSMICLNSFFYNYSSRNIFETSFDCKPKVF